jgi:ribosomal protein L3 glutamine methyltransferase
MTEVLDELITLRDWLRYAVSRFQSAGLFFGHGCDNAYDEAAWLILHTLHLPADRLDAFADARLTHDERLAWPSSTSCSSASPNAYRRRI